MHAIDNHRDSESQREVLCNLLARKMYWADEATLRAYLYLEDGYQKHLCVLKQFLGDLRGKLILDLGSGTGGMCVALTRDGARAIGIDLFSGIESNDATTARVRAACYGISLLLSRGRAQELPFKDHAFDAVVSIGMLEHIVDKRVRAQVIQEAMRVLKPSGVLFVTAHPNQYIPYDMHFGFLPFVNWLPKHLRRRYVSLLKPGFVDTVEDTENVSTREFKEYLSGISDDVVNVWPQMAIPTGPGRRGESASFLSLLSRAVRKLYLQAAVYWIARLMVLTSTELVVCLVARKPVTPK